MPQLPPKHQQHLSGLGFTIPELLAVVAVIVIIISILLPNFGSARETTRLMTCLSNQRQMAMATRSFSVEQRGRVPIGGRIFSDGAGRDTDYNGIPTFADGGGRQPLPYPAALGRYMEAPIPTTNRAAMTAAMEDEKIMRYFRCPSHKDPITVRTLRIDRANWEAPYAMSSYGFNENLMGFDGSDLRLYGFTRRIRTPASNIMLFADAKRRNQSGVTADWVTYIAAVADATFENVRTDSGATGSTVLPESSRHQNRVNISYIDGHATTHAIETKSLIDVWLSKGLK